MENSIIERLETLRNARGCSQASLARQCGIGVGNLNKMFKGKEKITDRTLYRIAETFNVSLEWLRDGIGEMYRKDAEKADMQYSTFLELLGDRMQANTINGSHNTGTQTIHAAENGEVAALRQKVAMLEEMLKDKDRQIAEKEGFISRLMDMIAGKGKAKTEDH